MRVIVVDYVFQYGAKLDGAINFRLFFGRKVNRFGITAAFDVENAIISPAMFIIADELAASVSREGGFAGARQAKEDGYVAILSFIGGTVHGKHLFLGHDVVHHGEDAFFHFSGIFCT